MEDVKFSNNLLKLIDDVAVTKLINYINKIYDILLKMAFVHFINMHVHSI